jgi:hypothetical protein
MRTTPTAEQGRNFSAARTRGQDQRSFSVAKNARAPRPRSAALQEAAPCLEQCQQWPTVLQRWLQLSAGQRNSHVRGEAYRINTSSLLYARTRASARTHKG